MNDIFKQTTEILNKPYNFKSNNSDFKHFADLKPTNAQCAEIFEFENVRIANNCVVFKGFKILPEPLFERGEECDKYHSLKKRIRFFLKYIIPVKSPFKNKTHILVTNNRFTNHYVWHTQVLGNITVLHEKGLLKDAILVLPDNSNKNTRIIERVEEGLKAFGINPNQIVYIPKKSNLKVKKLIVVVCPKSKKSKVLRTKEILNEYFDKKVVEYAKKGKSYENLGKKVYIARVAPYQRKLVNEKEVEAILDKYGYKKVLMEKLSYLDQVNIARNANVIVGPHGAGLANTFFMREGSFVLELVNNSGSKQKHLYITNFCRIASMCNLNYLFQFCKPQGSDKTFHGGDLLVDVKKLEDNLKLIEKGLKKASVSSKPVKVKSFKKVLKKQGNKRKSEKKPVVSEKSSVIKKSSKTRSKTTKQISVKTKSQSKGATKGKAE